MVNGAQKSKDRYLREKVDTFVLRVPKGTKEEIKSYAASLGKSLNSYIIDLINNDMGKTGQLENHDISKKIESEKTVKRNSLPEFFD